MALITCPECGGKVSDQAFSCPHCGYPISKIVKEENLNQTVEHEVIKEEQKGEIIVALRGPHSFSFSIVGGIICLLIYTFFLAVLFINSPHFLLLWLLLATALFASIALAMIHDISAVVRLNRMTGKRIYIDREKNVLYYQDASKEKKEIDIDSIIDISGPKTLRIKYRDNSLQKNVVKSIGWTTREDVLKLREFCRKDETK